MATFEVFPGQDGGGAEDIQLIKKNEKEETIDSLEDLSSDLKWTQELLEKYKGEADELMKKERFEALMESFYGFKLEDRFSKLNDGNDDRVSEKFLEMVGIKDVIENDSYLFEKKAA